MEKVHKEIAKAVILTSFALFLLLAGCAPLQRDMRVTVAGGGEFPDELAGTWRSEDGKWEVILEPDGEIREALIPLGDIRLQPGKVLTFPTRFEGKGIFEPGLWEVNYAPKTRELTVTLEIKHFYQDVGNHSVEGFQTDVLAGFINDEGRWIVELYTSGKIDALIWEGWTLIERREIFSFNEPTNRGELIFTKGD